VSTSTILVITHSRDLHAKRVIGILRSRGAAVHALDYGRFPADTDISIVFDEEPIHALIRLPKGEVLDSRSVSAVYHRRPHSPKLRQGVSSSALRDYIAKESQGVLDALPHAIPVFWLCHPGKVAAAACKPWQLVLAHQLGFSIPGTLISNSVAKVREFANQYRFLAVKTLQSPGIEFGQGGNRGQFALFTRRISSGSVRRHAKDAGNCPTVFEEYVEKAFELRITVVGDRVFSCAMYTQQSKKTREDFRRYDLKNTKHEAFQLPIEVEARCRQLVKRLGLHFGCIDMIVDKEGRYHFLEVNPSGQWLWTEDLAELPISRAIANILLHPPVVE